MQTVLAEPIIAFLFGADAGEGTYYASPEKSTIAYLVNADTVEKITAYMDYVPAEETP